MLLFLQLPVRLRLRKVLLLIAMILPCRQKKSMRMIGSSFQALYLCAMEEQKPQCYRYRVFGLPVGRLEVVEKIKPGMKLFLFDFELKLLYGIYEATSVGTFNLEQTAFNGRFPAQVRFKIYRDCLPLYDSCFRHAIEHNYQKGFKFKQELNKQQVASQLSLFHPLTVPAPGYLQPMYFKLCKINQGYHFPRIHVCKS